MRLIYALALTLIAALPARAEVDIKSVTSPGGITAWLVEEPSIPFVALEIRFRGGASLDDPEKRGAVNLMTGLLEEGAGDLDARAFSRAQEELASSLGFNVSRDSVAISARFLTENRDATVALLRAALHTPRFDQDAIDRVRGQVLSIIESDKKDPDTIASETFAQIAYGDHPYAHPLNGTTESVTALTRDDIVAAHQAVFSLDRIYVGAVGDITPEVLGTLLDDLLGGLPQSGAPKPVRADVNIPAGVTVVDFPTPQSVAVFGHAGISQNDDDFFAALILNQVLGGGSFESRLMNEVREKRGLTYGVYSYLASRDLADVYMGSVSSSNDRIAEAIQVIRDEWHKAAETGVTQEELDAAKTYVTGAYPLRFDGNGPIANILVGMQMLGLPIDYIPTRNDKVEVVTLADVKRVAAELLDPENLHFVVVGQPEGLETSDSK
ncbi:insulinase family protein [Sulfitobacter sp. M57]|uniref:M16 family metallopeptidase n=1 Tax=unclassified Sulfitobacter TaxID=196795 RepID=UPI0023E18E79|nr:MULTISPECIES: pitrilysin family protein [unclassified Sulfitobacter]MDF3415391.1 insulinase family protein [Sulfitobacter sp. KE5]MDF3422872.1 insulinase family protein [Sulfitobacter sp. KE43]MDF3433937.1 insulinase family protein [Sulfitobacter sp. KE42]MDF3459577.1 insulinase family protein [Sulfitobacter sp. S74]MDF3463476.1 insulinase family protein [Sulfitobacter sp. Ks18]